MKKKVLISWNLKFNFESSTWTVEVIRDLDSHAQVYWIFWEIICKNNLKYGQSMGSNAIALNFSKESDSTDFSMQVLGRLDF